MSNSSLSNSSLSKPDQHEPREISTSVIDQHRWSRHIQGRRIPHTSVANLERLDDIIRQANDLWKQTEVDIQHLKSKAYQEGLILGRAEASAQMAETLVHAQNEAQQFTSQSDQRLIRLATAMINHILPNLDQGQLISDLILSAISASGANRFLRIKVHPSALSATQTKLKLFKHYCAPVNSITIIADSSLTEYGCIVDSEIGTIRAGLKDQLNLLEDILLESSVSVDTEKS